MNWQAELDLATLAARRAGARLRELAQSEREVLSAQGRDIKLQADREAEAIILEMLRSGSSYPILAEESGEHGAPAEGEGPIWVIDPLDGTLNFSRGLPICCVSVGLMQGGQPLLGVVYSFHFDELFTGVVGEGAWLNGQPIRVSAVTEASKAILATGLPTRRDFGSEALTRLVRQLQAFKKPRMIGSAATSLAYVACGRVDAYGEDDIMLWDVGAGLALVAAAGGWISVEPSQKFKWGRRVRVAASVTLWQGLDEETQS